MANPQPEEVRIALVMNGGVSLAVWMGGVTNEIHRLVTQSHPVYREILSITNSTAKVDVISGTSAGGINGAALVIALLYGGKFESLRQVWMETGALEDLLSSPVGPNKGALLRGDEFFLPQIQAAFKGLAVELTPLDTPYTSSIDLQLTTTLLTGRQVQTVDALGTSVGDVDYRGRFHFRRNTRQNDFANRDKVLEAMSRAARSTASFPFAFEPSRIDAGAQAHLFDALGNPLVEKRHVVDGGVLNNKPIEGALQAMFKLPRERGVRRVLAYINPDPGDGPPPEKIRKTPSLYTVLGESLFNIPQSQSIADQLQEIAEHNREVQSRRDSVIGIVEAKVDHPNLARQLFAVYRKRRLANTCQLFMLDILPAVTSAEPGAAIESAEKVCEKLAKTSLEDRVWIGRSKDDPSSRLRVPDLQAALAVLGKQGTATIQLTFEGLQDQNWIPDAWPEYNDKANWCDHNWQWGMFPVEFAARVMLDLLRLTQRLADIGDSFESLVQEKDDKSAAGAGSAQADAAASTDGRKHDESQGDKRSRKGRDLQFDWHDRDSEYCQPNNGGSSVLAKLWQRAYLEIDAIELRRKDEEPYWDVSAVQFLCQIKQQIDQENEQRATAKKYDSGEKIGVQFSEAANEKLLRNFLSFINDDPRRRACAELASRIAIIVEETCVRAREVIDDFTLKNFKGLGKHRQTDDGNSKPHTKKEELNKLMASQLEDLTNLVEFFEGKKSENGQQDSEVLRKDIEKRSPAFDVLYRILQLEVIQYAFNDRDELNDDTLIELVQISANGTGPLGLPGRNDHAKDKLLGIQIAHFAAFYKQSWRVNDWTYGRLDGCERLVKLLLNPERLQLKFTDPLVAATAIREIAVDHVEAGPLKDYLLWLWNSKQYFNGICEELKFLSDNKVPLPDLLPLCAEVITIRLHLGILRDELPYLVAAIESDRGDGADKVGSTSAILKILGDSKSPIRFSPEDAARAYQAGLISKDRLPEQIGSDMFTRTLAHIVAATQRTLASASANLGPISALSASLRVPILGFYLTARGLTHQSRTSAALNGAVLATGFALVCLQFLWASLTTAGSSHAASDAPVAMPHILVTLGWLLFAYGMVIATLRSPISMLIAAALVIAGLIWLPASVPVPELASTSASPVSFWILFVVFVFLAYLSSKLVFFQVPVGLALILLAGIVGTGQANCLADKGVPLNQLDLHDLSKPIEAVRACSSIWLALPSVRLSLVIILAVLIAMFDLVWLRRVKGWLRLNWRRKSYSDE